MYLLRGHATRQRRRNGCGFAFGLVEFEDVEAEGGHHDCGGGAWGVEEFAHVDR